MELRTLENEEMSQVSSALVTVGGPARVAMEKQPMLAPLLPKLEAAHAAIVAVISNNDDPNARQLSVEEGKLDARHDDLVRAMVGALTTLSKISKAGDEMIRLRDLLFPEGLRHTTKTYRAEAGHAALVASWMNDELKARMKAVLIADGTLLDLVNQWIDVANQLGALEEQRGRLNQPAVTAASQIQSARRNWIRWINILLTTAENADIPADVDTLLFGPLRAAVQGARSRWGNHAAPAPVPAPTPVAAATPTTAPAPHP